MITYNDTTAPFLGRLMRKVGRGVAASCGARRR
jgi:hypothetical protein